MTRTTCCSLYGFSCSSCKDSGKYAVDYGLFNHTYEVDTPLCSSHDLEEFKKLREENQNGVAQQQVRPT